MQVLKPSGAGGSGLLLRLMKSKVEGTVSQNQIELMETSKDTGKILMGQRLHVEMLAPVDTQNT